MAALAYTGAKGNMGNAIKIANTMPPMGLVPAMAVANGGRMPLPGGTTAGVGVKLGMPGPQGTVGTAMAMSGKPEDTSGGSSPAESGIRAEEKSTGRLIMGPGRSLSGPELTVANQLVVEGRVRVVEAMAESTVRTADFLVDGVKTELKTLSNITSTDPSGAIARRILDGAGQALNIIVDMRGQAGVTIEIAERAAARAFGADKTARIKNVRLIGSEFDKNIGRKP